MEHLNQPLGYEIAKILKNKKQSPASIKDELPYSEVSDRQITRVLDMSNKECSLDIFQRVKSYGGPKYTLNTDHFTDAELVEIVDKAKARIRDNTDLTDEDFDRPPVSSHCDSRKMPSKWKGDDDFREVDTTTQM